MKVWKGRGQSESPDVVPRSYPYKMVTEEPSTGEWEGFGSVFFGCEILFKVVRPMELGIRIVRKY